MFKYTEKFVKPEPAHYDGKDTRQYTNCPDSGVTKKTFHIYSSCLSPWDAGPSWPAIPGLPGPLCFPGQHVATKNIPARAVMGLRESHLDIGLCKGPSGFCFQAYSI
jgi:hypothetical protein